MYLLSIFIILNFASISKLYSQINEQELYQEKIIPDTILVNNLLEFGMNKQQNIYDYYFNLRYKKKDFINFDILQLYNGNTLISSEKLSKDDEYLSLKLDKEIYNNISLLSQSNYILINYPGSKELSRVERINSLIGVGFNIQDKFSISGLSGPESNSQIGYHSSGINSKFNLKLDNFTIDDYYINFKNDIELLNLDLGRFNKDILFYSNVLKNFDEFDQLYFDFKYKLLDRYNLSKRDSLYIVNNLLNFDYSIENRMSNTYNSNIKFDFLLFDELYSFLNLVYDYSNVSKSYNQFIEKDTRTGIIQTRNFQKIILDFLSEYNGAINQKFGFTYDVENENNSAYNKNNISETEFRKYENLAIDLNFEQTILKLMGVTSFKLNNVDSIEAKYSSAIKRFDTPSLTNNSDRDELLSIVNVNYFNKINKIFSMILNAEVQLYHQVNLKASLSGSNYWMRTIKLGPQFIYKTNNFFMRPNFSILANYVTYDFEEKAQNIKSYSIRQIAYNDSLNYKLNKKFSLSAKLDIIYKETGILYWSDFEELPINGNLRLFSKLLLSNFEEDYSSSIGVRYYNLSLDNFTDYGNNYTNLSYGPEVSFVINFSKSNKIEFTGWYEFQFVNYNLVNEIPNFFIKSSILL